MPCVSVCQTQGVRLLVSVCSCRLSVTTAVVLAWLFASFWSVLSWVFLLRFRGQLYTLGSLLLETDSVEATAEAKHVLSESLTVLTGTVLFSHRPCQACFSCCSDIELTRMLRVCRGRGVPVLVVVAVVAAVGAAGIVVVLVVVSHARTPGRVRVCP